VDLRTGELRPARQSELITKATAVAPAATANCPTWLRFLEEATKNDAELTRFLQQWAGYSLTGITREHALVFVFGSGGNGKTVFINVLTGIVADYAASAAMETFAASHSDRHPTDLAMLRGARLVTASETEEGRAWAVL
jgi:putative DNA primase/helicase